MAQDDCVFCDWLHDRGNTPELLYENDTFQAYPDGYPVSEGHTLIIPKDHIPDTDGLEPRAGDDLLQAIQEVKDRLRDEYDPDSFNIGINEGAAAGQTVFHLHIHVIPRYHGDVDDPEGGVRGVIPDKRTYR